METYYRRREQRKVCNIFLPSIQLLLCFSCLEKILLHTTSTPSSSSSSSKFDHTIGRKLVQSLLASHMRPVYFSITSYAPNGLTAAALQLLTAMVAQGPRAARDVQVAFNFNFKPVGLLAHRTAALHVSVLLGGRMGVF